MIFVLLVLCYCIHVANNAFLLIIGYYAIRQHNYKDESTAEKYG